MKLNITNISLQKCFGIEFIISQAKSNSMCKTQQGSWQMILKFSKYYQTVDEMIETVDYSSK
jgi:hypothetical protein